MTPKEVTSRLPRSARAQAVSGPDPYLVVTVPVLLDTEFPSPDTVFEFHDGKLYHAYAVDYVLGDEQVHSLPLGRPRP
ncbi:MAG: hypothetical protein ACHQ50_03970 [Fimbriimonadales bacterium]